jgi:hypothetical protein
MVTVFSALPTLPHGKAPSLREAFHGTFAASESTKIDLHAGKLTTIDKNVQKWYNNLWRIVMAVLTQVMVRSYRFVIRSYIHATK